MGELTPASVKKLKVAELRSELSKLGLDTKGNKPVLVQRLLEAITDEKEETNETNEDSAAAATTTEEEESQDESAIESEPLKAVEAEKPAEEATPSSSTVTEEKVEEPKVVEQSSTEPKVEQEPSKKEEEALPTNDTEMVSEEPKATTEETKSQVPETDAKETQETSKEEPMDQTPAVQTTPETTTTSPPPSKEAEKPKEAVDHDTSVDFSKVEEEPEVELDDSLVVLDKYTNDLFIKVSPEALTCGTLKEECFLYVAGGVRATWGAKSGKVCFEVKVTELHEIQLADSEEPKNSIRVGWSAEAANLQLGEDNHSYGYDSSGKKCNNSEFSDFGQTFGKDDVITCYLDLESEVKKISFSKNGEEVGDAFELPEDIQDTVFFPHVSLKNADCSFNFGSQDEAWFTPKDGFTFIQNVADELKVHSVRGPANKSDCEVLMMIGLPASGKTTWVKKYTAEHPDKHFNVLGTNEVLDKMKLMGVARKQESGSHNKHMDKAAKCLHRLIEIAPSKKRNYILDQTNVYMSAQSKKMHPFEGYQRKAIVCIPTQSTLKERMEERKNKGTELPFNAICDMKRNFNLPRVADLFDEVTYIDQDEENSKTIVAEYIKEVGPPRSRYSSGSYEPDRKRPRHDDRPRHRGGYGGSGGWSGGSHRDNRRYDDRRGGYRNPQYNRRGNSPHYGSNRGGYRDNYRGGRGGYQGGGYHDRNRQGGNRSYGGGKSYSSGSSYGGSTGSQHRQQYNYNSSSQQSSSYSPQQSSYGNQYQPYYQQGYQQQYGQQQQTQQSTTQGYQQQQQQYPTYYQQGGTYQQGGYGYGY